MAWKAMDVQEQRVRFVVAASRAGSIEGDVKRKHFSPTAPGRSFSDIEPL
jgi:hypothetical protein